MKRCSVAECDKVATSKGMCGMHYQRWVRHGDVHHEPLRGIALALSQIAELPSSCWQWIGYVNPYGYGQFKVDGQPRPAHRVIYTALVGPVDHALHLDHLCRNRACVNPDHLEPVTPAENTRRGLHGVLLTHCPQGHAYTPDNVRMWGNRRNCKTCHRQREAARRSRRREVAA